MAMIPLVTVGKVEDRRSHEVLDYACTSAAGESRLTLFGNGTVRLRERQGEDPEAKSTMLLAELSHEELEAYTARLRTKAHDDAPKTTTGGPSGEWVEQCRLAVAADENDRRVYRFATVETVPLEVEYLRRIAQELLEEVRLRSEYSGFPSNYEPAPGDILERADGIRFRIERFTAGGGGLEIAGIEEPIVIYLATEDVARAFARLVQPDSGQ